MNNLKAWDIDKSEFPASASLAEQIKFICGYGVLAPSVHNLQPWRFEITNSGRLTVNINTVKHLGSSDPTDRQTWISIGCCVENILMSATSFNLVAGPIEIDDHSVSMNFSHKSGSRNEDVIDAIVARTTNRTKFEKKSLEQSQVTKLENSWSSKNTFIKIVTDRKTIESIAVATGKATAIALSIPEFKRELASVMRYNWSRRFDGIPGYALKGGLASLVQPLRFKYFNIASTEANKERELMKACGAIGLVFCKGDTAKFWFEAGRAYERMVITATGLGLQNATSAAIVEAPSFHDDLEATLGVTARLQAVVRLGVSSHQSRHVPRATLSQLHA